MRKYKYDGKEYDFDVYKKLAINNFDSWASERNLSSTRTGKIRQAMLELLQHMTDDESSNADLRRINFSTNYANGKGIFGKNVKDSKHYLNAAAYLLGRFNSETPYEEPKPEKKPKTKVTRLWVGTQLLDRMGNTSTYTDEQKRNAANKAFLGVADLLSKTPDMYEFEEGYDLPYFSNLLNNGAVASLSDDNFVDDNPYWGELGIANPFYKAPVQKKPEELSVLELAKKQWLNAGLSEESWSQALPVILSAMGAGLLRKFGLDETQTKTILAPPASTKAPLVITPSPTVVPESQQFDLKYYATTAKPFIEKNFNNLKDPKWDEIDSYMSKLVLSLLRGEKNLEIKPSLRKTTFEGKPYYIVNSVKTGNYSYAYNPESKEMVLIPALTSYVVYRKKKGGYLSTLREHRHA